MTLRPARFVALFVGALLAAMVAMAATSRSATAQVAECGGLAQEAEAGDLRGLMGVIEDPDASDRRAIAAGSGVPTRDGIGDDVAQYCVNVPTEGWYRLDATVRGADNVTDSFFVGIDEREPLLWDFTQSPTWIVDEVADRGGPKPQLWFLSAGEHTLRVGQREAGAALDRFEFVSTRPSCSNLSAEAEDGFVGGDMTVLRSTDQNPPALAAVASGAGFVLSGSGAAGQALTPDLVEVCLSVPADGEGRYRIEATVNAETTLDNSFFVTVDGGPPITWHIPVASGWQTEPVRDAGASEPARFDLEPGDHVVRFWQRESGTAVDRIALELETPAQAPWREHRIPGVVEAEDFDIGGNGVAYGDDGVGNTGGQYRPDDDVDIWATFGGEGWTVGGTRGGEWLEYEIDVATAGSYWFDVRVASGFANPGEIVVSVDGVRVGSLAIESNGWWAFEDRFIGARDLDAGAASVRVAFTGEGQINFDSFRIYPEPPPTPTPTSTPLPTPTPQQAPFRAHAVPGVIQAEDFDLGAEGVAFSDTDPSNVGGAYRDGAVDVFGIFDSDGFTVGRTRAGEWLEYEVQVASSGSYWFDLRVASGTTDPGRVAVTVDGQAVGTLQVASDGWWAFEDRFVGAIRLDAGPAVVRLAFLDRARINVDSFRVYPEPPPTPTATSTPIPTPTPLGVFSLHRDINYAGAAQYFQPGVYRGSAGDISAVGNSQASSHRIDPGHIALVCTNGRGTGQCRAFTASKPWLGDFGLNDNISYVQVRRTGDPIVLSPGSDVDQIVSALPAGTVFEIEPGLHSGHQIVPKANQVFNCQPGAVLDGNGVNGVAFSSARGDAHNVEIRGCEIRNYDQGQFVGAINGRDSGNFSVEGLNWLVEGNNIHDNEGPGVNLASGMIVRGNKIWNNSQIGVSGLGSASNYLEDIKVLDNDVYDNNFGPIYVTGNQYHEGGIKVVWTRNYEISDNDVFANKGFGIHVDLSTHDGLIYKNRVFNITESRQWIAYIYIEEDSYRVTARENTITTAPQNANLNIGKEFLKGIVVAGSNDNIVEFNTISGGHSQNRSYQPLGVNYYRDDNNNNNVFRGNTVNLQFNSGYVGNVEPGASGTRFIDNTYTGSPSLYARGRGVNWSEWRSRPYNYDQNGSYR